MFSGLRSAIGGGSQIMLWKLEAKKLSRCQTSLHWASLGLAWVSRLDNLIVTEFCRQ